LIRSDEPETLSRLLEQIYRDSGYDFRHYKQGTVTRRLGRRLQATGTTNYDDYLRFIADHPQEYERISQSLTITVSSFFRSQYAFGQLARLVFPALLPRSSPIPQRLRLWSVACARGEEPYSIAMALSDYLGSRTDYHDIKIYATDINRQSLEQARTGVFSATDIESVPQPARKHFSHNNSGYVINDNVQRMVTFDYFDLTSNIQAPFGAMDGIFCCNILIYLHRQLQTKLLGALCESLLPGGYLMLGDVESPTENVRSRLKCLDAKAKIYQKKG